MMPGKLLRAAGWLFTIGLTALYLKPLMRGVPPDFAQFYFAAKLVASGRTAELYHKPAYEPLEAELRAQGESVSPIHYFNRPAFDALLWAPLAGLSYRAAARVALLINLALLGILICKLPLWFRVTPGLRMWLVSFLPFAWSVFWGQDTLLLTLLVSYSFYLTSQKREAPAGFLLAAAAFKPHLIWTMPVALAAAGKRRNVYSFLAAGFVLAAVSFSAIGLSGARQWLAVLGSSTTDHAPLHMGNLRALGIHFGSSVYAAAALLTLVFFGVVLRRGSAAEKFGGAILAGLLLSPHTYWQDYSLVALVAMLSPYALVRYLLLLPWPHFWPGEGMVPFVLLLFAYFGVLAARQWQGNPLPLLRARWYRTHGSRLTKTVESSSA